jgi:NAD(P)-dependent dehydrogenase (short-subunit alcohol dehydrogenase family)
MYVEGIALGRAQTPEDVAAFVSFLAGPNSDYMTGQAPSSMAGWCTASETRSMAGVQHINNLVLGSGEANRIRR